MFLQHPALADESRYGEVRAKMQRALDSVVIRIITLAVICRRSRLSQWRVRYTRG